MPSTLFIFEEKWKNQNFVKTPSPPPPPPQDLEMASETRVKRCDRLDRKELEIAITFKKAL